MARRWSSYVEEENGEELETRKWETGTFDIKKKRFNFFLITLALKSMVKKKLVLFLVT